MKAPAPPLPGWLKDMLPFERYRLGDLHVMEAGRGTPVLMVHGNPTWGFLWRKVALALGGSFRAVMPDLLGLGLSAKPRDPSVHTIEEHGRRLGELVDALDLDRIVLCVQDWGGPMGLSAFVDPARARRLAGLVILNTVVGPPRPGFRPSAFHRFARLPVLSTLAFRLLGFPQNLMAFAQGDRASIRGDVARAYRWPLRSRKDNVAPLALARLVPDSPAHPAIAALERCQKVVTSFAGPVAIVWGDRDPVLGRVIGHLGRLLPQAHVTRTQAGHFLQEEVPDEIAEAIRRCARPASP